MMTLDRDGTIGVAVAEYTGCRVLELDVVLDSVPGVFAVQSLVKSQSGNAFVVQFLLRGVPLQNVCAGDLEEVEFTSWPPTARV
jgi:hypothetical protein